MSSSSVVQACCLLPDGKPRHYNGSWTDNSERTIRTESTTVASTESDASYSSTTDDRSVDGDTGEIEIVEEFVNSSEHAGVSTSCTIDKEQRKSPEKKQQSPDLVEISERDSSSFRYPSSSTKVEEDRNHHSSEHVSVHQHKQASISFKNSVQVRLFESNLARQNAGKLWYGEDELYLIQQRNLQLVSRILQHHQSSSSTTPEEQSTTSTPPPVGMRYCSRGLERFLSPKPTITSRIQSWNAVLNAQEYCFQRCSNKQQQQQQQQHEQAGGVSSTTITTEENELYIATTYRLCTASSLREALERAQEDEKAARKYYHQVAPRLL